MKDRREIIAVLDLHNVGERVDNPLSYRQTLADALMALPEVTPQGERAMQTRRTHAIEQPCLDRKYPFTYWTSPICDLPVGHNGEHRTGEVTW